MATVIVVEHAENLNSGLQNFRTILKEDWSSVNSAWQELKAVWSDKQYDKFEDFFSDLISHYQLIDRQCDTHIQFISDRIDTAIKTRDISAKLDALNK
jgi:hypothetical protein